MLIVIAIIAFLTFASAYVETFRNSIVAHDPYPVSKTA